MITAKTTSKRRHIRPGQKRLRHRLSLERIRPAALNMRRPTLKRHRHGFDHLDRLTGSHRYAHRSSHQTPIGHATKAPDGVGYTLTFEIERGVNGKSAEDRKAARQTFSKPLVEDLHAYMVEQRGRLSRGNDVARALDYLLKRWEAFTRFLDDGRVCLSNNAAERAVRGVALGRKSWLFAGSDSGGQRAAAMYSLIYTAKMNDIDPQAWLANVLDRINSHPNQRLDELLPWNWKRLRVSEPQAA